MTRFQRVDKFTGRLRFVRKLRPAKVILLKNFYGWCKNCLVARQSLKSLRNVRKKKKG